MLSTEMLCFLATRSGCVICHRDTGLSADWLMTHSIIMKTYRYQGIYDVKDKNLLPDPPEEGNWGGPKVFIQLINRKKNL